MESRHLLSASPIQLGPVNYEAPTQDQQKGETIEIARSGGVTGGLGAYAQSLSGYIYIDNNNDGLRSTPGGKFHLGLPGVVVKLLNKDTSGNWVEVTEKSPVMTGSDGSYRFDGLAAGTYRMEEVQPADFLDGKETVGQIGGTTGGTAGNDYFDCTLDAGKSGSDFNFGERGLRPGKVSLRSFLASTPSSSERIPQLDTAPAVDLTTSTSGTGRNATYQSGGSAVTIAAFDATATDANSSMLASMKTTITTTLDKTAPTGYTISLDDSVINATEATSVGFTFAGAEVGSAYRYIVAGGSGTSMTGSGTVRSATQHVTGINASALADGALTFGVTLTDTAGNTGSSAPATATLDKTAPTVAITPSASTATTSPITFTITFNEAVTGVNVSDLAATGSTAGTLTLSNLQSVSATVYKVDVTGMALGENVTLNLKASGSGIKDTAGNALAVNVTASVGYNTTASQSGFTTNAGESRVIKDLRVPTVLGTPIRVANLVSYRFLPGYGPDGHDLFSWTTTAESGGYFIVLDLATREVVMNPLGHLEGYPITPASNGNIYVGSSSGEIWRYGPAQQSWNVLARVWSAKADSVHHVRSLAEGRNGWLYAGSTFGERARIQMATGRVEHLPRIREPGSWYVSSTVALPDGRIAFGLGPKARIVVYDPVQGKDVGQWAPESWQADGYVLTMSLGRQVLFATHFPSGRRGAFDTTTGKYLGDAPWPSMSSAWSTWGHSTGYGASRDFFVVPSTDTIGASDGRFVHLWSPLAAGRQESVPLDEFQAPGRLIAEMSYGVSSELRVVELDWSTRSVVREIPVPPVPAARRLFALGVGPDGNIYGGAYQNMHLFRYDPRTQDLADLGNHSPRWSGETYSFSIRRGELIAASYVNGGVVLYDPARPWQSGSGQEANPRFVGSFGQNVYRPYATTATSDGRIWGVGAAGWGTTGGGIAWLDPNSGETESRRLPDSSWMIAELDPATLLVASEGKLRWWDQKSNRELASSLYPRGRASDVALLRAGPQPLIAFCDAAGLHLASLRQPGRLQVIKSFPCPASCAKILWESGHLVVGGPNGIAELDPSSGKWVVLSNSPASRWAFVATPEAVYFTRGAELLTVPRPQKQ
jgi:hypothetical protein